MQVLLTVAALFGLTALFSYFNERFLKLQQTTDAVRHSPPAPSPSGLSLASR
jgi:hypothetical protein